MDKIGEYYVYCTPMPNSCREFVTPCIDGYTVYINEALTKTERIKAFRHAIRHIESGDFKKSDVQKIESATHQMP